METLRKIKHWLQLWDGIWSVPLAVFMFLGFGKFGEWYWGEGFGAMTPEFLHAVFYSAIIIVSLNFTAWLGVWFNYREVFRYYLSQSKADYNSLPPLQKICVILFVYSLYFVAGLIVIARLV